MFNSFLQRIIWGISFFYTVLILLNPASAEIQKLTIKIKGMACPFCAYGVEKKLKKVEGVKSIDIDIQKGLATLTAKEGQSIGISQIPQAIKDSGFTPDRITATVSGRIEKDKTGGLILKVRGLKRDFTLTGDGSLLEGHINTDVVVTGEVIVKDGKPWTIRVEKVEAR
jgi:mercuric ion binding protein